MKILTSKKQDGIAALIITMQRELDKEEPDYCRIVSILSEIADRTLDLTHLYRVVATITKGVLSD